MRMTIAITLLLAAGVLAAGCAKVDVDVSDYRGPGTHKPAPPPDPASDPRSIADLQQENAQLRQTLATLEQNHRDWDAAVDRKKDEIDALKDQRDNLEKQRDRAKEALED